MVDITTLELDELERKARAATPGKRTVFRPTGHAPIVRAVWTDDLGYRNTRYVLTAMASQNADNDADLAAALDQAAALAFIAAARERDELRAEVERLHAALKTHAPYSEWCRDPLACHNQAICPRDPNCGE